MHVSLRTRERALVNSNYSLIVSELMLITEPMK